MIEIGKQEHSWLGPSRSEMKREPLVANGHVCA